MIVVNLQEGDGVYSIFQTYLTAEIGFLPTYLHLPEHHPMAYHFEGTGLR